MSKWHRLPVVSKQVTDTNQHEHFTKTSISTTSTYHEQQRFENSEDARAMFAFELHKRFRTSVSWDERKAWAGLFLNRHPQAIKPTCTSKMKIKVEFADPLQVEDFLNRLQQVGISADQVKSKEPANLLMTVDRDFHVSLLKVLNDISPFSSKMRRDVLAWHFQDPNCNEAQKFSDAIFGPAVANASHAVIPEIVIPIEVVAPVQAEVAPSISVAVETDVPVVEVSNTVPTETVENNSALVTETVVSETQQQSIEPAVSTLETVEAVQLVNPETNSFTPVSNEPVTAVETINEVENLSSVEVQPAVEEEKPFEKLITPPGSPTLFSLRKACPEKTVQSVVVETPEVEPSMSPRP